MRERLPPLKRNKLTINALASDVANMLQIQI